MESDLNLKDAQLVYIEENDPKNFLNYFWKCIESKTPLFIGNPDWTSSQKEYLYKTLKPDVILGTQALKDQKKWNGTKQSFQPGSIFIPTGGSSGNIRFAEHSWESLQAPTQSILDFFKINTINSCCLLPLYHISGLIQAIRTQVTHGYLFLLNWKDIENGLIPEGDFSKYQISLVPTQLKRLLANKATTNWLREFNVIFLGGAPAHLSLLDQAKEARLPIAQTYGMTETAAMVALGDPKLFLKGIYDTYQILPHAKLKNDKEGNIWIQSKSLFKDYYPKKSATLKDGYFCTSDIGIIENNHLKDISRSDSVIITGGKKVDPKEVENILIKIPTIADAIVSSKDSPEWGKEVIAVYQTLNAKPIDSTLLQQELKKHLEAYKVPKKYIFTQSLPKDNKGKINKILLNDILKQS